MLRTIYHTLIHAALLASLCGYYLMLNGWELRAPPANEQAAQVESVFDVADNAPIPHKHHR